MKLPLNLLIIFLILSGCSLSDSARPICAAGETGGAAAVTEKIQKESFFEVCWEGQQETQFQRERAQVAAALTEEITGPVGIEFFGWRSCAMAGPKAIHIAVVDQQPHTVGIGTDLLGETNGVNLNFSFKNWDATCTKDEVTRNRCIRAAAVHEFMHALGMVHEHSREDTPDSCAKEDGQNSGAMPIGAWDGQSVMNYCNPIWNNGGHLSQGDIEALKKLYPKAGKTEAKNREGSTSKQGHGGTSKSEIGLCTK